MELIDKMLGQNEMILRVNVWMLEKLSSPPMIITNNNYSTIDKDNDEKLKRYFGSTIA